MNDYIIILLIITFTLLFATQLFHNTLQIREEFESGSNDLTFHKYTGDDELQKTPLSTKNTSNIQFIVQELSKLDHSCCSDLSSKVSKLDEQVKSLVQSQKDYATKSTPSSPPKISGS
jgi:hypothetical protein